MHPIIKKTLICLLLLLTFLALKKINLPIARNVVIGVDQALNIQYDYQGAWQEVQPTVANFLTSWQSLEKIAKIRLTPREPLEEDKNIFLDLEGQ